MRASRCRVRLEPKRDIPLNHVTSQGSWTSRPSALLHLVSKDGTTGSGELAPLPGYSVDDFDAGYAALSALEPLELHPHDFTKPRTLLARIEAMVPRSLPAARFALSSAAMDWIGQQAGISAWELLLHTGEAPNEAPVPLCALLPSGKAKDRLDEGAALLEAGYRTLKFKLPSDLKQATRELPGLLKLLEQAPGGVGGRLRLDANQGLPGPKLGSALKALSEFQPELLEEPTTPEAWAEWTSQHEPPIPLAADESLFTAPSLAKAWLSARKASAVVLKPTCLGVARCLDLADQARSVGVGVTVSHCFEGPIGFTAVAAVALAIASRDLPSGLAPPSTLHPKTTRNEGSHPPFIAAGQLIPWATSGLDTEFAVRG